MNIFDGDYQYTDIEENTMPVEWAEHSRTFTKVVQKLYNDETFADCSLLSGDGLEIPAHRIILSAASPLFNSMLRKNGSRNPVLMLPLVSSDDLFSLVEYIYKGLVDVEFERLRRFLDLAKSLQVVGLDHIKMEEGIPLAEPPSPPPRPKISSPAVQRLQLPVKKFTPKILPDPEQVEDTIRFVLPEPEIEVDYLSDESTGNLMRDSKDGDYMIVESIDDETQDSIFQQNTSENFQTGIVKAVKRKKRARSSFATGTRSYNIRCDTCSGLYKSESTFNNHLKHDCNKFHNCDACKKTFKNKRHLLDHVRDDCGRIHKCPCCSKEFKQKVNLTTHMKMYCKTANPQTS